MDTKKLDELKEEMRDLIFFWHHSPEETSDELIEKIFLLNGMKKLLEGK